MMRIAWLKAKFGMNKHADMVKVLNNFLNTCRNKDETLLDFIARFDGKKYLRRIILGMHFLSLRFIFI